MYTMKRASALCVCEMEKRWIMPCLPAYTWSIRSFECVFGSKKRLVYWQQWVFPLTVDFRHSVRLRYSRCMFSSLYRETDGKKKSIVARMLHVLEMVYSECSSERPFFLFYDFFSTLLKSCWSISFVFICSFKMTCFGVTSLFVVEIKYWWVHQFPLISCFKYLQLGAVFRFRFEFNFSYCI